jgi:D-glycero-D-manno-heptose 1,7-bisphosphate phosphatase
MDRDGTLNCSIGTRPPSVPQEVELLPGVAAVLSEYVAQGWLFVIVSNQGGVASGYVCEADARAVQQQVVDLLPVPVAASYFCPHMPNGSVAEYAIECPNRKPKPGFILTALEQFDALAEDCLFVGDSSTDRLAAEAAGVAFRWADLFFGRPIDRSVRRPDGRWAQVAQVGPQEWVALSNQTKMWATEYLPQPDSAAYPESLALIVRIRSVPVGWLSLSLGELEGTADLAFGVHPAYRVSVGEGTENTGIGALLLETALEWARAQPGLERLCVQVHADNLPVSQLCCRYGFDERLPLDREGGQEWIQLDCTL